MKRLLFISTYTLLFITGITSADAQWINQQQLTQKMDWHNLANPAAMLFVHFDKTIYTNNETAWFTAYVLKAHSKEVNDHQVLSVALVRDVDSLIITQDKYSIYNGVSFGSMVLPDSMLTGNYHFQVTTNRISKGKPEVVFIQPVVIKTNIDPAFNASIKLLEPGLGDKKPNQLVVAVTTRDARFLPKPVDISYKYGNLYKKSKTNASGELVFSIYEQPALADPNVYAKIKYGRDSSFINLALPVSVKKASVKFYPEGGTLIEGLPCKVAWEVKDQQAAMVTLKAELFKDNKVIDTIETNSYGIGSFILTPEMGDIYTVRLMHPGFADSIYHLPAISGDDVGLFVKHAVAGDTLILRISSTKPQKIALRLHDFRETYLYKELNLDMPFKTIKIPLTAVPKGLKTITVFDSLGRPLAERMVFAHYSTAKKLQITTDQPTYNQRQKVTLKLKLNGPDSLALVSVACIQDNRLAGKLTTDIESYAYLGHELDILPLPPVGRGYEDKAYLEDLLLTKGWRRYTWSDILKTMPADTLKTYDTIALKINVKRFDKPLKKPVQVGLMRGTGFGFGTTNQSGELLFKNEELLVEYGKKIRIFVSGKDQLDYAIKTDDPYIRLNKSYLKSFVVEHSAVPSTVQNNSELMLKNNEKVIRLKEVQITSGRDNSLNYKSGSNSCGDYVCRYNILNCRNHYGDYGNTQPIPGKMYANGAGGGMIVYKKCEDEDHFIVPLAGIYTKKDFYVNDFSEPLEPAFVSTIYWNHGLLLNTKEQEVIFYTSDITGKFSVVVQGVTNNDLIYGHLFFEVRGK